METTNIIQCPYCKAQIEPWDFVETGDIEGGFTMNCTECGEEFSVSFETDIKFKTSK